jgi:hypothetical protein
MPTPVGEVEINKLSENKKLAKKKRDYLAGAKKRRTMMNQKEMRKHSENVSRCDARRRVMAVVDCGG